MATADIEAVQTSARQFTMGVHLGLEVDFVPEKQTPIQALLQDYPWDFLIGSVHEIDGVLFERAQTLSKAEGETLWLRYLPLSEAAVT